MQLPHRHVVAALVAALTLAFASVPASAKLLIEIDKSTQRMVVSRDGERLHTWPVSTGVRAYDTPSGSYTPFRLEKDHFSKEWDDAPMPHSIFFTRSGHAIHGTTHVRAIGRAASHGCVRLEPENARVLFEMVKREGLGNVRVVLNGVVPAAASPAVARRAPQRPVAADPNEVSSAPRGYRPVERAGYWVQQPDGTRVFVDRERGDPRLLPPPQQPQPFGFPGGPFGSGFN
jgi:hypothetical protein